MKVFEPIILNRLLFSDNKKAEEKQVREKSNYKERQTKDLEVYTLDEIWESIFD